ncbi:MAG TPA: PAS domain-containing protein [bacterium (Candidatus Stahlbacteria)]|nr:PAS domain-containing protein [Candidatus Stahlbacteria bacterium]
MVSKKKLVGLDLSVLRPFLEGLLKNMVGGVFSVDMEKRILSFNKAAEWITGFCYDDVIGKPCYDIFKTDLCGSCPFDKVISSGVPVTKNEVQIHSKENLPISVSYSAFRLDDIHGNKRGMVVIFRDISEVKILREQLVQSEKLAVLGQLAAGVAHEINNPINGIITYVHLLRKRLDKKNIDLDKWKDDLMLVERETQRIGRLVKNLLNFSRKSEPDLRPLKIDRLVEDTLPLLSDQFLIKHINIKKEICDEIPEILGDFNQLQQVLLNLIVNSIQAVDEGGTIIIRVMAEGRKGSECFVRLEIEDDGVGIPREEIDTIFDPFYTTKSAKDGGIGLGLSIVQQIVKTHHGRISINSEVGKGTNFSIVFPTL